MWEALGLYAGHEHEDETGVEVVKTDSVRVIEFSEHYTVSLVVDIPPPKGRGPVWVTWYVGKNGKYAQSGSPLVVHDVLNWTAPGVVWDR